MYIERALREAFLRGSDYFPAMLLVGPRQVGKTTFLRHLSSPERKYVTLDNMLDRDFAKRDPAGFLERYGAPVLIDEIQYAPELLPYLKIAIDQARHEHAEKARNMFWLTGSQQFQMMKGVSESLAGRIGILEMLGLSQREMSSSATVPFLPDNEFLAGPRPMTTPELFERIFLGSFPGMVQGGSEQRELFYSSYVQTYLERDIRDLGSVGDLDRFFRFLRSVAARTAQLLNYAELSRDADISIATAKSWLSILEASNLVYLLEPYANNLTSRLVKTPKLYLLDTGLAAFLTQWPTAAVLETGAMSGAFFETWCLAEILKSYYNSGKTRPGLFFYRDKDMKEIDLLIEQNGRLYPVEIKKTATPRRDDSRHFQVLRRFKKELGMGAVVCMYPEVYPCGVDCRFIPAPLL